MQEYGEVIFIIIFYATVTNSCSSDESVCDFGLHCINSSLVCDGLLHCRDFSDELGCSA